VALGHIHKQYETENVRNPGSLEAFDIQEGRWDDEHGYYIVDTEDWTASHHLSKRRPYYTVSLDVSEYRTFGDLQAAFTELVRSERDNVEAVCNRTIHQTGDGGRRDPIINARLTGTLHIDHSAFDLDELCAIASEELDALYVQPTDSTERQAVQELLGDLDRDEAFHSDGSVNTDALQERVFTRLAEESRYSDQASEVASALDELEGLVTDDEVGTAGVAEYLQERRRELFPDGIEEVAAADTAGGDAE
jgi:DNA repair exonuclease SbcCD nuclease subunit